jgi:superoxide reductase
MAKQLDQSIKTDDFKNEKHVPVIECADTFTKDEMTPVKVTLGKEIAHPNTTEHHIRWIELYFQPQSGPVFQLGRFEFAAHGESANGPNEGSLYTHHEAGTSIKAGESGTLMALAYCNIHGLWESSKDITVQ